jgi:hypothetical protein
LFDITHNGQIEHGMFERIGFDRYLFGECSTAVS